MQLVSGANRPATLGGMHIELEASVQLQTLTVESAPKRDSRATATLAAEEESEHAMVSPSSVQGAM